MLCIVFVFYNKASPSSSGIEVYYGILYTEILEFNQCEIFILLFVTLTILHFMKSVSSKEIYAIADASILNTCWLGYHTLDIEFAIDRLIEAYHQNKT